MSTYFCSLGFKPQAGQEQVIPTGKYTLLRFPFGAQENVDPWDMHPRRQPGGAVIQYPDPRTGLIWPTKAGLGCLELNVIWMDADYTELRDVFVRDPLGTPDETAYDHRARTPGEQCFTKTHWLVVRPDVPLGVMVGHNGSGDAKVRMAQFKLTILDDIAERPPVRHRHRDALRVSPNDMANVSNAEPPGPQPDPEPDDPSHG